MAWQPPAALIGSRASEHVDDIKAAVAQLIEMSSAGEEEGWSFSKEIGSTSIAVKSSTCMRGSNVIPASAQRVQMTISDLEQAGLYTDLCSHSSLLEQLCDDYQQEIQVVVGYIQLTSNSLFTANRDYVFLQASVSLGADVYAVVRYSTQHPLKPEVSGFSRGEIQLSGYLISPCDDNSCTVVHVFCHDLGGMPLVNTTFGKEHTEEQLCALNSIRTRFESQQKGSLSALTSRTRNLFSGKDSIQLQSISVDQSVLDSWVGDLLQAADSDQGPCEGWVGMQQDKLLLETKDFGASVLCVRSRLRVPAAASDVFELVSDVTRTAQYDHSFVGGRVVRNISNRGGCLMTLNWCAMTLSSILFSDRDFCYLQLSQQNPNGSFVVLCRSVEDSEVAPKAGFVRGTIQSCGYVVNPVNDSKCEVAYVCAVDLEGMIPKFVSNKLLKEAPLKLTGIADYFKRVSSRVAVASTPVEGAKAEAAQVPTRPTLSCDTAHEATARASLNSPGSPAVPGLDFSKLKKPN